jgi:hypothetical protein
MPGLGGKKWSREHAVATAETLNAINPGYIRLRTLCVRDDMPLYQKVRSGEMERLSEDEVVKEIRLFIEHLRGIQSRLASDHILNLLEEVEGSLPQDQSKMLGVIDRYLSLPDEERLVFKAGRRAGVFRRLDDLEDGAARARIDEAIHRLEKDSPGKVEEAIQSIMANFI